MRKQTNSPSPAFSDKHQDNLYIQDLFTVTENKGTVINDVKLRPKGINYKRVVKKKNK